MYRGTDVEEQGYRSRGTASLHAAGVYLPAWSAGSSVCVTYLNTAGVEGSKDFKGKEIQPAYLFRLTHT